MLKGSRVVTPGRSRLGLPGRVLKAGNEAKVRVVVRVRPFLEFEQAEEASARTEVFKGSDGEDTLRISDKLSRLAGYYLLSSIEMQENDMMCPTVELIALKSSHSSSTQKYFGECDILN